MRTLLLALEDTLGTLSLALGSPLHSDGRPVIPMSKQTDLETIAHVANTIDGLLALLECERHQKRPEPTFESRPLLTLPMADDAPGSPSAQPERLSPAT